MKFCKCCLIVLFYAMALLILSELCVNILAFRYLLPIKNANSYGYLTRKSFSSVIPLNKYTERYQAQLALPYELFVYKFFNYDMVLSKNEKTNLYGYKNKIGKIVIEEKYIDAREFYGNYAIVAVLVDGKKMYGSIDKKGNWVIKPKYSHICSLSSFYTRVCLDNNHCGVINIYGDEMTAMVYHVSKIKKEDTDFAHYFCKVHLNNKKNRNYCF